MTTAEKRRWIKRHFATYIALSDAPGDCPDEVAEVWADEVARLATSMGLGTAFDFAPPLDKIIAESNNKTR